MICGNQYCFRMMNVRNRNCNFSYNCTDIPNQPNNNIEEDCNLSYDCTDSPNQPNNNIEEDRLYSFRRWTISYLDKNQLALFGFYYTGTDDVVKCQFCKVEIGRWDVGDNPLVEHLRWSPRCPLITRRPTANIPINEELLLSKLPLQPRHDVDVTPQIRHGSYPESRLSSYNLNQHPDYTLESDRKKSFKDWPIGIKQKAKEMADAGFFYLGRGDQVKCFSCGGGLKEWEEDDVPWEQHALVYDKCQYVNLVKGKEYINQIKEQYKNLDPSCDTSEMKTNENLNLNIATEINTASTDLSSPSLEKLCKVCYVEETNTVVFPCMHVATCAKCALSLSNCPICREKISDVKRVYFS